MATLTHDHHATRKCHCPQDSQSVEGEWQRGSGRVAGPEAGLGWRGDESEVPAALPRPS